MDCENLRIALYPLGFCASLAFASRTLSQWIASERQGKSVLKPSFWRWSCAGNALMAIHALIQLQVHICVIQTFNLITSIRNLQLMQEPRVQTKLRRTLYLFPIALCTVLSLFVVERLLSGERNASWLRTPQVPWADSAPAELPAYWHLLGCLGMSLFALRFYLQWWQAERQQKSELPIQFWWISLLGAVLSLIYFLPQGDLVHILAYATGLIPYIRNLMLLSKQPPRSTHAS